MGRSNINKTCFDKVRHETPEEAMQHIDYLYENLGETFDYYKCPICNGYHLTTKRKKK